MTPALALALAPVLTLPLALALALTLAPACAPWVTGFADSAYTLTSAYFRPPSRSSNPSHSPSPSPSPSPSVCAVGQWVRSLTQHIR